MAAPSIKLQQDTGTSATDKITSNYQLLINSSAASNVNYSWLVKDGNGVALTGWLSYSAYTAWMSGNQNSAENTHLQVQATLKNNVTGAGNVINPALVGSLAFTLDKAGPAESVNSIHLSNDTGVSSTDFLTKSVSQTITGTLSDNLAAGDVVMVSMNNGKNWAAATTHTGQSTWSLATTLKEGSNTILAYVKDAAGNQQASYSQGYALATKIPTVTATESVSGLKNVTTDIITIATSAEAVNGNKIASVGIYNGANLLGYASANSKGDWIYTADNLADGSRNSFHAVVTDTAGNTHITGNLNTFSVATQAPLVSIAQSESGLANGTKDTLTITASADAPATGNGISSIAVYDNSKFLGNASPSGKGVWSYTTGTLQDGAHHFTAMVADKAGNSASASANVTIASHAPIASATETVSGLTVINSNTISINATAENISGNTIQSVILYDKYDKGFVHNAILQTNGDWVYTANGLADGNHHYYAVIADAAGNQTSLNILPSVAIATQAPTVTATQTFNNTGVGQSYTISGTAVSEAVSGDAINSIAIYETYNNGSKTLVGNPVLTNNNTWTYTASNQLTAGTYSFSAVVTDKAGNVATDTLPTLTVAALSPTVSAAESVAGLTGLTSDTIYVNAVTDASTTLSSIAIYDNGVFAGDAASNGNGVWSYTDTGLTDGNHKFTVLVTDSAGNYTLTPPLPTLTVASQAPTDVISQTSAILSKVTTDTISGVATVDNQPLNAIKNIEIFDGSKDLGKATVDTATGNWSYKASNLADGDHGFSAVITDNLGNQYTDTSLPVITIATGAPTDTINQSSAALSNVSSDTISGAALAEAVTGNVVKNVEVFDGSTDLGAATLDVAGNWTFNAAHLSDGNHSFSAVITDSAGNQFTDTGLSAITIAVNAPADKISQTSAALSNVPTDTISGLATAEAVSGNGIQNVEIYDGSSDLGAATLDAAGNWSFDTANLSDGVHSFSAVITDNAGNKYTDNSLSAITVATSAPTDKISQTSALLSNATTDTISGTATGEYSTVNPIKSVEVFDGSTDLGAATLDTATGGWSFDATSLTDGNHAFTAVITDSLGNQYIDKSLPAIMVDTQMVVVSNPNPGDQLTFSSATSFDSTAITAADVTAAGGSTADLAGWVAGALSPLGADTAQNHIAWFNFDGNTYLVEQFNAQGTAFDATGSDTLVQLVGTLNESGAVLAGHTLTL